MYIADEKRYDTMIYNRAGRSGLKLPAFSLGLWHNFGGVDRYENSRSMLRTAFDLGITHFDLANDYGPPPGSAEENFGRIFRQDFVPYRDEIVVSTKAGYMMWPGPYGEWGSKKYLLASLDQSLKRMGLDYVDIFYSHRPDPETPMEETMGALDSAVRQGKTLYAGISSYDVAQTKEAAAILRRLGTPCLIHQPSYNMFDRWVEDGLLDLLDKEGMGMIAFVPLAQGMLTNKYFSGIPAESRAAKTTSEFQPDEVTPDLINKAKLLNGIALERGQSLAQMALAWLLRDKRVTSVILGASRPEQIIENVQALKKIEFSADELARIDRILGCGCK